MRVEDLNAGRQELVGALLAGPATAEQLAETLGRNLSAVRGNLLYLTRTGFVTRGERRVRRGPFTYRLADA